MENEITPQVKAIAEEYGVHPSIAQEMPQIVSDNMSQPETEATVDNLSAVETSYSAEVTKDKPVVSNMSATEQIQGETSQAKNFRQLREKAERAERERDELIKLFKQQQSQTQQTEEPDYRIDPDAIVEGKHLSRYDKKMTKIQQDNERLRNEMNQTTIKLKLNSDYPDFHKVVNADNIAKLEMQYPELAATLNSSSDLYSTGVSTYTILKKLNIAVEDNYENDRYKVQQNLNKPKPVVSVTSQQGSSPLAQANAFANGLTDELRKSLIKEMAEARKGL